jgi:hypothetical protein
MLTNRSLSCLKIKQLGVDHVGMDRIRSTRKARVVRVVRTMLAVAVLEKMGTLLKIHDTGRGGPEERYGCRK